MGKFMPNCSCVSFGLVAQSSTVPGAAHALPHSPIALSTNCRCKVSFVHSVPTSTLRLVHQQPDHDCGVLQRKNLIRAALDGREVNVHG